MEFRRHENRLFSILVESQCLRCCTKELLFSGRLSKRHGCTIICLLILVYSFRDEDWMTFYCNFRSYVFSYLFLFLRALSFRLADGKRAKPQCTATNIIYLLLFIYPVITGWTARYNIEVNLRCTERIWFCGYFPTGRGLVFITNFRDVCRSSLLTLSGPVTARENEETPRSEYKGQIQAR
jgi:hypothetical protein